MMASRSKRKQRDKRWEAELDLKFDEARKKAMAMAIEIAKQKLKKGWTNE